MPADDLEYFVEGQVWQCRNQEYTGTVISVREDRCWCEAALKHQGVSLDIEYNYDRARASVGRSYSVSEDDKDAEDLMHLIYCPTWDIANG